MEVKLQRVKVPGSKSSLEHSFLGAEFLGVKGSGSESSGSKLSMVLLELLLKRVNWPGSEKTAILDKLLY